MAAPLRNCLLQVPFKSISFVPITHQAYPLRTVCTSQPSLAPPAKKEIGSNLHVLEYNRMWYYNSGLSQTKGYRGESKFTSKPTLDPLHNLMNYKEQKPAAVSTAGARPGIEVETEPERLLRWCCGANIYKEGEDPLIKPDSEYPEWLWDLRLERESEPIESLNRDSWKYWRKLRKLQLRENNMKSKLQFK